jgi:hypothetical protein
VAWRESKSACLRTDSSSRGQPDLAKLGAVKLFSASEYEFGFIAVGATPIGVIALGLAPVGVLSIGIMPVGLVTFACGGSLGLVNFVCGVGVGGFVRAIGVAIGGDASAVGFELSLARDRDIDTTSALALNSYWIRMGLVAALVLLLLWPVTDERLAVTHMDRVVRAVWRAHPSKSEGIFIAPDSECRVDALMRSDGDERLHVDLSLTCGSLRLAERQLRSGCTVVQRDDGRAYDLRCNAERIPARETEDDVKPELPGLAFDSLASPGSVVVQADGPPPMRVELRVDSPSEAISGGPLLDEGVTELTGASGRDYLRRAVE